MLNSGGFAARLRHLNNAFFCSGLQARSPPGIRGGRGAAAGKLPLGLREVVAGSGVWWRNVPEERRLPQVGEGGFPTADLRRSHLHGSFFSRSRLSRGVPSCAGAAAAGDDEDGDGGGDDAGSCAPKRKCRG